MTWNGYIAKKTALVNWNNAIISIRKNVDTTFLKKWSSFTVFCQDLDISNYFFSIIHLRKTKTSLLIFFKKQIFIRSFIVSRRNVSLCTPFSCIVWTLCTNALSACLDLKKKMQFEIFLLAVDLVGRKN